ncbi:MAG: DUF3656 domain-containing protein [Planctomycetales bacterium]
MHVDPIPELLSPAGDAEALRAAVANGADAVYFGLADFNARHRAANFTVEELPETMRFLHEHGVRGYVTFNTLIFSEELSQAQAYLQQIIQAGADAVIVQDLGIVELLRKMAPGFAVHGSTQMTLTEPRGIEFVRDLGVERVILARELSLREIETITHKAVLPVEVFVHGALCVAYSGQCLTSEAIGGRSANRGQCAQACRQPYELIVDGQPRDLGDQAYLLSPQDLAAYDLVGELSQLGVASLKIEGRLKSAHYVAATTQTYRAALDAARAGEPFSLTTTEEHDLAQSFSRGFSHGFLSGINHQELVQGRFPKNRGVCIGSVTQITSRGIVMELADELAGARAGGEPLPLKPGDGVVFDEGHPEQDEQGGRLFTVTEIPERPNCEANASPGAGQEPLGDGAISRVRLELTFGRGTVNLSAVSVGATLWKTDDPALRRRLEQTWTSDATGQRVPIIVEVSGAAGEPLTVTYRDEAGHSGTATTDQPVQAARKHPLTQTLAMDQLGRLGGTPFHLARVELVGPGGACDQLPVMVPKSVLNDLRRSAVAQLVSRRRAGPPSLPIQLQALDAMRIEIRGRWPSATQAKGTQKEALQSAAAVPRLSVLCRTLEQLQALADWQPASDLPRIDLVYCDFEDVRQSVRGTALCREHGLSVALATPRIIKPGEEGLVRQIANCQPQGVLVRNLAALHYYRERHPGLVQYGDYALNIANELTADLLARHGLRRLTPGYDLNMQQLEALLQRIDSGLFEIVLHQHIPMFHMEHCVFSHVLSNGRDCHDCGRPCDRHRVELRDHVGEAHPLVADVGCRNTLFAARAQSAAPYVPRLLELGIRQFRVELLREDSQEARGLVASYARVLAGRDSGPRVWRNLQVLNQIGLTRGTLAFE